MNYLGLNFLWWGWTPCSSIGKHLSLECPFFIIIFHFGFLDTCQNFLYVMLFFLNSFPLDVLVFMFGPRVCYKKYAVLYSGSFLGGAPHHPITLKEQELALFLCYPSLRPGAFQPLRAPFQYLTSKDAITCLLVVFGLLLAMPRQ